ncbi:hypothetical protein V0288_06910 [Pannus brasiliensis CCIBt3594]|uniref:Uncharacterized protein n=1 Tax=Pannus brasiliensis CCIBt3594 TaxID=1427578 RepID=A0AAW9QT19_9CHRO
MNVKPKQPRSGAQRTLWEKLDPDHGYLSRDIYEIARDCNLSPHTAKNMLTHGLARGYLIQDPISDLFYRSDSTMNRPGSSSETPGTVEIDLDNKRNDETIMEDLTKTILGDLAKLKNLKLRKEAIERELKDIDTKISELNNLERFL